MNSKTLIKYLQERKPPPLADGDNPIYNPGAGKIRINVMRIDPESYQAPEWEIPVVPTETDELPRERQSIGRRGLKAVLDVLETLILAAILFIGINAISARIRVDGTSMEPSLANGEFIIVNKLAYKIGSPSYGDVVVFRFPRNPTQEYIKRIIGLPGDTVHISNGNVYVNEAEITEPYIAAKPSYSGTWLVPEDNIFVLGDNRNNSSDSHTWGPVPYENMVGKAFFIYWPLNELGLLPAYDYVIAAP